MYISHAVMFVAHDLNMELCVMNIYEYHRLSDVAKEMLLRNEAIMIESYYEKGCLVLVYFLNGFFVEIISFKGEIVSHLPFERGYKVSKSLELKKKDIDLKLAA